MTAKLKIVSPGMLASLQDKGRFGYGGFGVPRSGAIDPVSLRLGNALVGNDPFETAIEFRFMGPTIKAQVGSLRVALACHVGGELIDAQSGDKTPISPWQTVTLNEGDVLKVNPMSKGATGYLTIEGGLDLDPVLDSCSTYARAHMGSLLQVGDILSLKQAASVRGYERLMANPVSLSEEPFNVIFGPQEDYFEEDTVQSFLLNAFKVSSDVDRMGIRLEGNALFPKPEKGSDLISDGLVAGAIQVPGNGHPIILCVDCQSVGGYPKVATIISADLHRLGQLTPGKEIKFKAVNLEQAGASRQLLKSKIEKSINSIHDYYGEGAVDLKALYASNLIGGVVDAQKPGLFPGHLEDLS
ncbi:5-oxoprolinase subunit C family protein [Sneathiella aquimaris]|uniref:5-oxoprolinase subunit C family protein n=1 Tax=Sneathiella aquimaris TaxID=2599305 RepID=UPI00146D0845|nr:biotin-dependent carboxyltransferase family protein [Sneathiella aquimaris]